MRHFPYQPPDFPPVAPGGQLPDDDQWRREPPRRGRRPISTTQILLGIVILAIAATIAAFCFGFSDSNGLEAAIVSPEDGSTLPPGTVVVRIRASGGDETSRWDISYLPPGEGGWVPVDSGSTPAYPSTNGMHVLDLQEPGVYQVRLSVQDPHQTQELVETVQFTITP
jgi:hypothetical protein